MYFMLKLSSVFLFNVKISAVILFSVTRYYSVSQPLPFYESFSTREKHVTSQEKLPPLPTPILSSNNLNRIKTQFDTALDRMKLLNDSKVFDKSSEK